MPGIIDELLPRPSQEDIKAHSELQNFESLPNLNIYDFITSAISIILALSMTVTVIAMLVIGVRYLMAQGDQEQIGKQKDVLIYLLVGLIIMAAAYTLVVGISQFNFFTAAP